MKPKHLTILLVDDEPNDLFFIEHGFRAAGVEDTIRTVGSGNEAIAYLEGRGRFADRSHYEFPTIILTDLKMPNGDGFTVLEALKNHPEWSVIPAAILSASEDEDDIKRAYLLGVKAYLSKPNDHETLRKLLQQFYQFWCMVHLPQLDVAGGIVKTYSQGKIGSRFDRK